jgi:hypothetical protein
MPYTKNTQEIPMLWRIQYDKHTSTPETFIVRWDSIIAVRDLIDNGDRKIRIYFGDSWIQFSKSKTPDAVALFDLWNNQCILQEY